MKIQALIAGAFAALAMPALANDCTLDIADAWLAQAPPSARVRVAYAIARNPGAETVVIDGASSSAFGAVELHEMREHEGVARMRRLDQVPVPAGDEVHFQPGGKHFMMFRPGDEAALHDATLTVRACGQEFTVPLPIRERPSP